MLLGHWIGMPLRNKCARFSSMKYLRHILQGVSQLPTQILDVEPLPFLNRLASEVYIVYSKLGLIKEPLDNKDWT